MKKILVLMLVLVLAFSLVACGGGGSGTTTGGDEKLLVGLAIRDLANPYYVQLQQGAKMFLDATVGDGNYDLQIMESQGSDDKQVNDIKAFLARAGVGGNAILYVDPNNAPVAAVVAELCEENQTYWNTTWSYADGVYPMDYEYYVVHQTADNQKGAYETAVAMFDSFDVPGTGKVVAIQGMLSNDASIDREIGWKKALSEYPNVELLDIQPSDWSPQKGLALIQTWIAKYGDQIDGVLVANDTVAMAVTEGLRAEGLAGKVKVVGFDGIDDILPMIESGEILGTYGANPFLQAGYGLSYSYQALTGEMVPSDLPAEKRMIQTKGILISTTTLADYIAEYVDSKPVFDYSDLDFCISSPMDQAKLH